MTLFERCLTLNFTNSALRTLHFIAAKRRQTNVLGSNDGHILRDEHKIFPIYVSETIIIRVICAGREW